MRCVAGQVFPGTPNARRRGGGRCEHVPRAFQPPAPPLDPETTALHRQGLKSEPGPDNEKESVTLMDAIVNKNTLGGPPCRRNA